MRVAAMTSLMAFAVSAAGIVITSPRIGEKIDFSKPVTIKWQRVSTDPTTVDIVLVNEDVYPPVTETVASGVDADMGSYTIKAHKEDVSVSDTGGGYQVNFLSPSGGILAQSQQFKHAFFHYGIDGSHFCHFDFCFSYYFFSNYYSLFHQCVSPYHLSFLYYCIFYFLPHFVFYDDAYQSVFIHPFTFYPDLHPDF
ncbi:Alpha/beta hydrolase fold-3 [Penicillium atrosanguineum]|uniref:Alpha/beta hydrolase fold-3 n=1 Tax=Penicillium atrosanguineum TaxID=1132637 RepID=UPI00238B50CE|nr:Alpha/beta hydrolase fold-3 [Penicillium atrosanguineum]KAJ5292968.1 Alpha/beta hydrolase fold-3 [Penicillium atrosanguineum]